MPKDLPWHARDADAVAEKLQVDPTRGLSSEAVAERQKRFGKNQLRKGRRFRLARIIFAQFTGPLSLVLILAGVATVFLGEYLDGIVIAVALLTNVTVGTWQEGRASKVFKRLAATQEHMVTLIRDGHKTVVAAEEVVPGDVFVFESGVSVPADIRIIEAHGLRINEAALTGEWAAVEKHAGTLKAEATVFARKNLAWRGTTITQGRGTGIAVATGMHTQIGKIARDTQEVVQQATPLQKSVRRLAHFMMGIIAVAIVILIALGVVRGEPLAEMLLVAIAVAVAAMPEGLPAAVTVVLAVGMEAILRKGGLVRSLLAAETLGSTTIILTDKTGTLTEGRMAVAALYSARGIDADVYEADHADNRFLLQSGVITSDGFVEESAEGMAIHGGPIEKAVLGKGMELGIARDALIDGGDFEQLDFLSFESKRRFSASLNKTPDGTRLYFAGAPELLLEHAKRVHAAGGSREMEDEERAAFKRIQKEQSEQGRRFIAVAYTPSTADALPEKVSDGTLPSGLVFAGLISFADPVRSDVVSEIRAAQNAGIRVKVLTGDFAETARAIASEVGIATPDDPVITGEDIGNIKSDEELLETIKTNRVFARVLPEQKLRIARVLRSSGEVVAMTGDGVNDAPALVSADIGVAVGSGTDVAKEAADIVLLNNTFTTITAAIREGRRIVDNLKKIVGYLLSTSFSEIIVIGGALAVGAPLPLLPTQILWANIVEEGLMSFPFAFDPPQRGIMNRPPEQPADGKSARLVLSRAMRRIMVVVTLITSALLLALFFFLRWLDLPIEEIRTVMFVALSLDSIFFAFSFKNLHQPLWKIHVFDNKLLLGALGVSIGLLIAALTFPPLQTLLSLTPLTGFEVLLLAGLGLVNLLSIEVAKIWAWK